MTSRVQIANIALVSHIGTKRINSLDEAGPLASMVKEIYDGVRQEILSVWPWSFATERRRLARISINDRPEWAFRYAVPSGMLRLNWVNDAETGKRAMSDRAIDDTARDVVAGSIYSDTPDALAEYVFDNNEPSSYSPKFIQAFGALLAARMAVSITETQSKAVAALEAYVDLIEEAKVFDARLEPPVRVMTTLEWGKR